MLSSFDKAMVPIAISLVTWLNQKYGFHFDVSPENMTAFIGGLSAIIVYFVPNKGPAA